MRYLAAVVLLCLSFAASAADVKLSWTAPTACSDGSAISNCAVTGYEIQHAAAAHEVFAVLKGIGASVTTHTLTGVTPGNHCYLLRANSARGFSANSNVACIDVPAPVPGAPMNVTVTVTVVIGP